MTDDTPLWAKRIYLRVGHAYDHIRRTLRYLFHRLLLISMILIIGMIIGFVICVELPKDISSWIYAHETLTTGLLAIAAALVTTSVLIWQTIVAESARSKHKADKFSAARASLAIILSELSFYCDECIRLGLHAAQGDEIQPVPSIDEKRFLEVASENVALSEGIYRKKMTDLMHIYQMQRSRLQSMVARHRLISANQKNDRACKQSADWNAAQDEALFMTCVLDFEVVLLFKAARNDPLWHLQSRSKKAQLFRERLEELHFDPYDWPLFLETVKDNVETVSLNLR